MRAQDDGRLMQDHAELGDLLGQLIATLQSNDDGMGLVRQEPEKVHGKHGISPR